jgi:hypothetical protein
VKFLTTLYQFPGTYFGGCFSSSQAHWQFLDGGIISQNGYGWGSHSWTVVEGSEAVRVVCLWFGIKQPRRLKGEGQQKPLAVLLEQFSAAELVGPTKWPFVRPVTPSVNPDPSPVMAEFHKALAETKELQQRLQATFEDEEHLANLRRLREAQIEAEKGNVPLVTVVSDYGEEVLVPATVAAYVKSALNGELNKVVTREMYDKARRDWFDAVGRKDGL